MREDRQDLIKRTLEIKRPASKLSNLDAGRFIFCFF